MMKCRVCDSVDTLKMCSRCQSVAYCCVEHQRKDWQSHKPNCNEQFSTYTKPQVSSEVISQKQMIEVINGPIQGDFYIRDRDNISGMVFHFGDERKKFLLNKDIIFLPLSTPEIDSNTEVIKSKSKIMIYLKDSVVKVKSRNLFALDMTVVYEQCTSYQFLSFTMDQIQMLQAAFDYVLYDIGIQTKVDVALFSNSEVVSSILGTMLLAQVWRTYTAKPFEIKKLDNNTIPKYTRVSRNLITYKL
jgi:hypothetical protein